MNIYSSNSSQGYVALSGRTETVALLCFAIRTDWGTAARRVKCNKLAATGRASNVGNTTVKIGW